MTDRRGAKKLFKTHKGWMAAGVAAATLFSVSVFGGNTVSVEAASPEPVSAPSSALETAQQALAAAQ